MSSVPWGMRLGAIALYYKDIDNVIAVTGTATPEPSERQGLNHSVKDRTP